MRITQADFRTVRIVAGGLTVLLRYSLYQDGDERLPESIACRGDQVTAYFLASTIRDFIAPERHGLSIQRSWTVLQEGRVGLSFCLEFLYHLCLITGKDIRNNPVYSYFFTYCFCSPLVIAGQHDYVVYSDILQAPDHLARVGT